VSLTVNQETLPRLDNWFYVLLNFHRFFVQSFSTLAVLGIANTTRGWRQCPIPYRDGLIKRLNLRATYTIVSIRRFPRDMQHFLPRTVKSDRVNVISDV
jgi:hypothetical protein